MTINAIISSKFGIGMGIIQNSSQSQLGKEESKSETMEYQSYRKKHLKVII